MSDRSLAHVEKIISIEPIDGADRIVKSLCLGWICIVKKDSFNVNDKIIYIEIDSIVANIPYFEFMYEPKMNRKGRVKTAKMKKQISQGLIIPLSDINIIREQLKLSPISIENLKEGQDVTKELGIVKYESPSDRESNYVPLDRKKHNWFTKFMTRFSWYRRLTKQRSKSYPEWISKTDEERVANIPWVIDRYKDLNLIASEKIEGQSGLFWYKKSGIFGSEFGVCSRTVRKFEFDNSNWSKVARLLDIKKKLKSVGKNIAIQGEVVGPSIQGNIYELKDLDFYIFNVFDIDTKKYYTIEEALEFCKTYGFKHVPILDMNYKLPNTLQELIDSANGKSVLYDTIREGIVIRSPDKSISFKVVSPEYLLKRGY